MKKKANKKGADMKVAEKQNKEKDESIKKILGIAAKIEKTAAALHEDFMLNVKMLRTKRHLTQDEAAELAGITRERWSECEIGRNRPSFDKIIQIAHALRVEPAILLDPDLHRRIANEGFSNKYHVTD